MRCLWLGLIGFAACYAPAPQAGGMCSPSGACPSGQTCVNDICVVMPGGGPMPDAPPGAMDRDSDGVPDDRDNCPADQNTDQLDEDRDMRGDVCDVCAHVSDDGKDADGDGVPDACDPGAGRHSRWLFEGFHGGAPAWPGTSNWTAAGDGDSVRVTASGLDDEYRTLPLSGPGRAYNNFSIRVAFTIDSVLTNGPELGLSLYDNDADRVVDCQVLQNGNNAADRHLGLFDYAQLEQAPTLAWQTGQQYVLTMTVNGTSFSCNAAGPGGPQSASGTSPTVARDGGALDLWVYRNTVRIDWLFVVGTP